MNKETRLNLRITETFREDIETLAEYHGLSLSSFVHSLLVKEVRRLKMEQPEAFAVAPKRLAPVVARIEPPDGMTKDEIRRRMIDEPPPLKLGDQEKRKKTG